VVIAATIQLLTGLKGHLHTITADNGKEFAYHEILIDQLDTKVYFRIPIALGSEGLNENTNGLLRQYLLKE
jgi:IS30 family transposase